MAGINQTTMMALAMVTIASMVAAGGLGDNVLRALQKNQPGNGAIAGLAIVFLAIIIDRLTQSVAQNNRTDAAPGEPPPQSAGNPHLPRSAPLTRRRPRPVTLGFPRPPPFLATEHRQPTTGTTPPASEGSYAAQRNQRPSRPHVSNRFRRPRRRRCAFPLRFP